MNIIIFEEKYSIYIKNKTVSYFILRYGYLIIIENYAG